MGLSRSSVEISREHGWNKQLWQYNITMGLYTWFDIINKGVQ